MARNPHGPTPRPLGEEDWSEDRLVALIRTGARGEVAGPGAQERVRKAVRAEWRGAVKSRSLKRLNRRLGLAVAALVGVAVGLHFFRSPLPATPSTPVVAEVARVERVQGALTAAQGGAARSAASGEALKAGVTLRTGADDRAALRLATGVSLRLDCATRIVLDSGRVVRLEQGAVYVDTDGKAGAAEAIEVRTPSGSVRDVGTQFEARLVDDRVRLRVREGRVTLRREADTQTADAGQELLAAATGQVKRAAVSPTDASWDWALACAPPFDAEGKTLRQLLQWAGREGGWEVRYADAEAGRKAAAAQLHGSLGGLSLQETLEAALAVCGLKGRIEHGVLRIESELGAAVRMEALRR